MKTYPIHPLSAIFPPLRPEQQKALTEDIRAHGLKLPVTLFEGKILDGKHRQIACVAAGMSMATTEFVENGQGSAQFVISQNMLRRHLSVAQLACVGAELLHQKVATNRRGRGGRMLMDLTACLGIGSANIARCHAIMKHNRPAFEKVKAGKLPVNTAYLSIPAHKLESFTKRKARDLRWKTAMDAESYIRQTGEAGWSWELNFEGGMWMAHAYGTGVLPLASWSGVPEYKSLALAVKDAAMKINQGIV